MPNPNPQSMGSISEKNCRQFRMFKSLPLKVGVCLHSDIPLPGGTTDYELNVCSIRGEE